VLNMVMTRGSATVRSRVRLARPAACTRLASYARTMQRNPRWEVLVSIAWGIRAAGR
jgi:hypothetical protein